MIKHRIHTKQKDRSIYTTLCSVSFVLLFVTLIARLYFSGAVAAKNEELRGLLDTKSQLEKEITRLKYEESKLDSLTHVEENAKRLGFVPMQGSLASIDISSSSLAAVTNQ